MKKVITMVGTSLFENFLKTCENETLHNYYEELKEKRISEWENQKSRINKLNNGISNLIKNLPEKEKIKISAEIKSLYKLKEELKDEFEIYLLISDTILSKSAGEIVKELIEELEIGKVFCREILGLQIWDREEFKKGMSNLIDMLYKIAGGYWDNIIINITGGFKATIPFLTILAQLNGCPIYYIFEDTDALIKIPNIPFSKELIDWKELDKHFEILVKLEKEIEKEKDYQELKNSEFYQRYSFLIWEEPPLAGLNPIGKIILEKYKEKSFIFYGTDEVIEKINKFPECKDLISKFSDPDIRENKTDRNRKGHHVYDDGDNPRRVFYRKKNGKLYVYKIFCNHDEYDRYLKSTPYNENILTSYQFKLIKLFKEE